MARNKKHDSVLRAGPLMKAVTLCALFAGLGLGYVWYKDQIDLLGRQIKENEVRLGELQRQNKMRREQLATLCSPVALDARVKQLNLGLGPPALWQVIRLVDARDIAQAPQAPEQRPAGVVLAARRN
jgi:ABC-type phosphate transport system auxiliary subunit